MSRERKGREEGTGIFAVPVSGAVPPLDLSAMFDRPAPLEIDLGCGKGRFLLARARQSDGLNFLGVDRNLRRLAKLNQRLQDARLVNVRLIHTDAMVFLETVLPSACVTTFYVFFPDPWPKRRHHGRRLVSERFVNNIDRALQVGGQLHFATDHVDYFKWIQTQFSDRTSFQAVAPFVPRPDECTDFELRFLKIHTPICRCAFRKIT